MSTLSENTSQAIHDFYDIKDAIEYKGVDVPESTATCEYSEEIKEISEQEPPAGVTEITENDTYDVSTYANAHVAVSEPSGNKIDF